VLTGFGEPLLSYLLTMDLANASFAKRHTYKDPDCPVCGSKKLCIDGGAAFAPAVALFLATSGVVFGVRG
jgi:hypothetical protein